MAGKLKSIAVYCGHQMGTDPQFKRDARAVGRMLARNGIRMVFGGGDVGLMGTVATAALDNGGTVIGVSTDDVIAMQEPAHAGVEVYVVDGVNERKQVMFDESDAFIILAGGIGTLNELTDILTMQQIGETDKPLFFLNTNGFWKPLATLIRHMKKHGFIVKSDVYNIAIADNVAELKKLVLKY